PSLDDLRLASLRGRIEKGTATVVAVRGLTGDLLGGLVVTGKSAPPEATEERLLAGFALQFGAALEMRRLTRDLERAHERREAARMELSSSGIELVKVCPHCRLCASASASVCSECGRDLPEPLLLPYRLAGRYRLVRLR